VKRIPVTEIDHAAAPLELDLRRELRRLRHRGCAGGFIARHRAMVVSPVHAFKLIGASVLVVALMLAWYALYPLVARFWVGMLDFWQQVLGLGGYVTTLRYRLFDRLPFDVPYLGAGAGWPGAWLWWGGLIVVALLVVVSLLLPRRYLPIAYMLRIVAGFQATAQVFFAFWPRAFPYTADGYVHGMLIASVFFISLVPILLGFTYYIFDFSLRQKLALTAVIVLHQIVMIPLQYVAHAWVMHHFSVLFLPVLFFIAGLPLNVVIFIALYSWGFSWPSALLDEETQERTGQRYL